MNDWHGDPPRITPRERRNVRRIGYWLGVASAILLGVLALLVLVKLVVIVWVWVFR